MIYLCLACGWCHRVHFDDGMYDPIITCQQCERPRAYVIVIAERCATSEFQTFSDLAALKA